MSEPNPILRIQDASKSWYAGDHRIRIFNHINLSVYSGESLAIMGPSGAGKSTLLHVLGFLTPLEKGSIWFNGKPVSMKRRKTDRKLRSKIGFIFQDAKLISNLTILENVCLPLVHRGIWPHHQKKLAIKALAEVGLKERLFHKPSQLSGGELMRTAIARAIVQKPNILLVDEPTGNLDSKTGKKISDLLFKTVSKNRALIFVTHYEPLAQCADRIIYMKDGRFELRYS